MSGRLPNAPLVYACASVRFSRIGEIHEGADALQALLRKSGFPLYERRSSMTLTIDQNGPSRQEKLFHIMNTADGSAGFMLATDSLFFHTLDYETFERSIAQHMAVALEGLVSIYGPVFFTFAGNRYIDWIRPREGEQIADYVREQLVTLSFDGVELVGRMGLQHFKSPEGVLLLIRHFGAVGHPPVPDDLNFSCLQLSQDGVLTKVLGSNDLVVDTDANIGFEPRVMTSKDLVELMREVHATASAAFKSPKLFTDHARKVWGEAK